MRASAAKEAVRKLTRRSRSGDGRLESLGQDYNRGHRDYVEGLAEGHQLWLHTKPFSAPPSEELTDCLRTFTHVVEQFGLGLRAQILDVGCGPGWMSELLARCGYWVTGVDISEDMVEIARERIRRIPGPVGEGVEPLAEFHAIPVRQMPWSERFDAAILYDTMHHFDQELETLRVINRALVPGGRLYIREGTKPKPGSEAEQNLIAEMERHGTLESPFDPEYLVSVVRDAGFEHVVRLMEVDELVDPSDARAAARELRRFVRYRRGGGDINTIVARKPLPVGLETSAAFSASIEGAGEWHESMWNAPELELPIRVENTGTSFWPAETAFPYPQGVVNVAPYVVGADGERRELARAPLPHGVRPGESIEVTVRVRREELEGVGDLLVDVVREGVAWFGDLRSKPLVVPLRD